MMEAPQYIQSITHSCSTAKYSFSKLGCETIEGYSDKCVLKPSGRICNDKNNV